MRKITFFLLLAINLSVFAQQNYLMTLTNPNQINSRSFEFDVVIKSVDTNFTLSSYQCSFSFNISMYNKDSVSLKYIENSSELDNGPINIIGFTKNDGINELIFVSGIGNDIITLDSKLVGKFKVEGTMDLSVEKLNLLWNFTGSVNTILTGVNFSDITVPENHINFDNSITDLNNIDVLPNEYSLSQNYPNPFNPSTKIDFTLKEKGLVKITIFNMIGQRVITVLENTFSAGIHTIEIDGRNLSSGAYIYKMEVGNKYSAMRKMIILK